MLMSVFNCLAISEPPSISYRRNDLLGVYLVNLKNLKQWLEAHFEEMLDMPKVPPTWLLQKQAC